MSTLVAELEDARSRMKAAFHGIGEPVVLVNPDALLVSRNDPLQIHMRMDALIATVRAALSSTIRQD